MVMSNPLDIVVSLMSIYRESARKVGRINHGKDYDQRSPVQGLRDVRECMSEASPGISEGQDQCKGLPSFADYGSEPVYRLQIMCDHVS